MKRILFGALGAVMAASCANAENVTMYGPEEGHPYIDQYRAAPVIRAGDFLFVSGVVGAIPPETERTSEAYEAAIREVFVIIEETLGLAGADWGDVVEMTSFHVEMREHQDVFAMVREEFITDKPYPAWTAIGVEKLWVDPLFVEVRVTAYVGE